MCNFVSGVSAMSGFSLFIFVYFSILTLMFRHGRVMLQIKNLFIARAVEMKSILSLMMATDYKKRF